MDRKSGGPHQGIIVADPINAANRVLSFSGVNVSGDILTAAPLSIGTHDQAIVSFDYLGLSTAGSTFGNLGGFIGNSTDLLPNGGDAAWIAGTELSAVNGLGFTGIELIDDGQWRRYEIDVTALISGNNISSFYLMLEDWQDAGRVAGDVFFDNIEVKSVSVPETPSTISLLLGSLSLLLFGYKVRKSADSATVLPFRE